MLNKRFYIVSSIGKEAYIRKLPNGKYRVYSEKGKNMGTFDSKEKAQKHLREIEYFKHKKAEAYTQREQEGIYRTRDPYQGDNDIGVSRKFPSETSQSIPESYEGEFTAFNPKAITPYTASPADFNSAPMNTIREGEFEYDADKNFLEGELYWDEGDFKDEASDEEIFGKLAEWMYAKFRGLREIYLDNFTEIDKDDMRAIYEIEDAFETPLAKDQIEKES